MGDPSCRSREFAQRQRPMNEPECQQRVLISLGRLPVLPPPQPPTLHPTSSHRPFQHPHPLRSTTSHTPWCSTRYTGVCQAYIPRPSSSLGGRGAPSRSFVPPPCRTTRTPPPKVLPFFCDCL